MNALPTSGENLAVTIRFKTYGCIVLAGEEESLVSDVIKLFPPSLICLSVCPWKVFLAFLMLTGKTKVLHVRRGNVRCFTWVGCALTQKYHTN